MKILIAPDSFKGSLSAREFCTVAEGTLSRFFSPGEVVAYPMADGGEGTVESLVLSTGGEFVSARVTGPHGRPVEAVYGILGNGRRAVIEMAQASGLPLLSAEERNPFTADSRGTGELILHALDRGCREIIMGIGGSATNDAGVGMLAALGYGMLDKSGRAIPPGANGLLMLDRITTDHVDPRLEHTSITVACDVESPLYGATGAAYVFARQKGARLDQLEVLDAALQRFAQCAARDLGADVAFVPGAGAAGGMGAGLLAIGASLRPGFSVVAESVELREKMEAFRPDLVITGEGQLNAQTLMGKAPGGVARMARQMGCRVAAIVGLIDDRAPRAQELFDYILTFKRPELDFSYCIENAPLLLSLRLEELVELILPTAAQ